MSDPVTSFEFILKNQSPKTSLALYSASKQQNKHTFKPQDVISSVSSQLKAIQVADSFKIDKRTARDLKCKTSTFISVNNIPVYDEPPKQSTKFDTQCVSDTQLINIIEDAEILDVHRGMTQEFETPFANLNKEKQVEDYNERSDTKMVVVGNSYLEDKGYKTSDNEDNSSHVVGIVHQCDRKTDNLGDKGKHLYKIDGEEVHCEIDIENDKIVKDSLPYNNEDIVQEEAINNIPEIEKEICYVPDNIQHEYTEEPFSQILNCKVNLSKKMKTDKAVDFQHVVNTPDENYSQIEDCTQILNQCIEIKEDDNTERPPSPIFMNKNIKIKSKSPSPLVYNLDKFEHFESIAISLLETNNLNSVKHVINSQILDKELHIKMDEDVELNERDKLSPVFKRRIIDEIQNLGSPIIETNEIIEIDKVTSDEILKQLTNQISEDNGGVKTDAFKDEILFSSDEEEDYVHKEYQDLPFTCALETSFYDQSDVLDKTMYVGFQTASNRSIQVGADSFARARSILNDVTNDTVTVTELVKHCDNSLKDTSKVELSELNVDVNKLHKDSAVNIAEATTENTDEVTPKDRILKMPQDTDNCLGFMTANNKKINLSQKSLARCKKVFQDIDLNENFNDKENVLELARDFEDNLQKIKPCNDDTKNLSPVDDVLQDIDDDIMQEFENTEMSLEDDNPPDKDTRIGLKTASNQDIKISEVMHIFKDIDFDDNESKVNENSNIEEIIQSQIISNKKFKNEMQPIGFKTASKKNINISKEAWIKSKNLFENIDATEFPNKLHKHVDKAIINIADFQQPSTSKTVLVENNRGMKISCEALAQTKNDEDIVDADFSKGEDGVLKDFVDIYQPSTSKGFVGFKTASNKNIKISEKALSKSKNIFHDIDNTEIPKKTNKDHPNIEDNTSIDNRFVGFKTANNKNIQISKEALLKTKNIFNDIDSPDFIYKNIITQDDKQIEQDNKTLEVSTVGFKSANTKLIKISDEALAKTRNIFKDIDSLESEFSTELLEKDRIETAAAEVPKAKRTNSNPPGFSETKCVGFKTANNKGIEISNEALTKAKNVFGDIDSTDFILPEENKKDYPEFGENGEKSHEVLTAVEKGEVEKNIELNEHKMPDVLKFRGFKTASNKQVKVSSEALIKSKNIFKDIENSNDFCTTNKLPQQKDIYPEEFITNNDNEEARSASSVFKRFQTANKKPVAISAEALEKSKNIFEDSSLKRTEQVHMKAKFSGFQTASKKQVIVSSEALMKSKHIFKDIENSNDFCSKDKLPQQKDIYPKEFITNIDNKVFKGFQTANKKPVAISAEALDKSKKIFEDLSLKKTDQVPMKAEFSGFQTASNKQVRISDKALAKSRLLFKDIDGNENIDKDNRIIKEKSLYPQEIYQHEEKFDDCPDVLNNNDVIDAKPMFKGFHTASKKPVTISKDALERSKKLFQDIDQISHEETKLYGFQTGNNQVVKVSEKALTETNKLFDNDRSKSHSFKGFQTANNQKVNISEEALAKTRNIFQEIDTAGDRVEESTTKTTTHFNLGFQTGNNKHIEVSEEAIARSKRLFSEIDNEKNSHTCKKDKKAEGKEEDNINAMIDTQVINNFEVSLHTEDFHETPKKSKRSGSPILSCPKAKKRKKFETPYNLKTIPKPIAKAIEPLKNNNKITFREDYKKSKRYTLKDLEAMTKDTISAVDPYLLNFDYDNLLQFEFNKNRNGLSNDNITIDLLREHFLNSVNSKLVPYGWIDNHLKLILWKLISYEIKFKSVVVCSAKNVIDQLKYRYDRELYNAQRPALRKIFEKDDVPSKTMVLCIVGIYVDGVKVSSVPTTPTNIELLLTDGWYTIRCILDRMLSQLVCDRAITVGSKIVTCGAELTASENGVAPWEDTSAIRLKIFGNSTRRARWDARLGYHGNGAILSPLSSVRVLGGKVSRVRVFVTRVYPALYVEKFEDGSTVTRSERLENLHQMKAEAEMQTFIEKLYEEVERELAGQESQDSEGLSNSCKRPCMDSGSQIAKMMKRSKDPAEFRAQLTDTQSHLLEAYTSKNRDRLLQDIQTRVRDRVEKAGVALNRNVVSLLKIRVAGLTEKGETVEVTKGMMSIWKPNDAICEIIKEGAWINVLNVMPTAVRYSEIQISAGRQSVFSTSKYKPPEKFEPYLKLLPRQCYTVKDLALNPSMATDYNEIDTIGLIFLVDPSIEHFDSTKQSFQNVYITDADKNMICVNFWGGLKKFGFQNVLDTGQVVACVNLQKRAGNTRKCIPQFRVTEFSYFTQTPKNEIARRMVDDLNKKFTSLDRRKFCQDCVVLKNNYSVIKQNNENVSPYRFMNTDINLSKNKMFVDSPLVRPNKMDDNFSLTGLDFESTFKQDTQLSEEVLKRKRKVNEKIARLKMYGEPPPLSPMHIINRNKQASSSYKSPLLSNNNNSSVNTPKNINIKCLSESDNVKTKNDSSTSVASVENTPQKCGEVDCAMDSSPVLLNRTYVKSVNPVKINFDMKDNYDSNVDHFAEEFDGSPPLSLD